MRLLSSLNKGGLMMLEEKGISTMIVVVSTLLTNIVLSIISPCQEVSVIVVLGSSLV